MAQEAAKLSLVDQLSNEQISVRLGARGVRDVAMLLKRARDNENPLVKVKVDALGGARPETNERLGQRLAKAADVQKVLVVKTSLPSSPVTAKLADEQTDDVVMSHVLHRQLGQVAAHYIWDHLLPDDILAVGAGRGVRNTIDELGSFARRGHRHYDSIKVISLAGSGVIRSYPRQFGTAADEIRGWPELEPDEIALELARILNVDFRRVTLVRLPFVLNDPTIAVPEVAPHLQGKTWADRPPDKAIFGLGVLNGGHHLMVSRGSGAISAIEPMLKCLETEVLSECPTAVIDVYDTFWVRDDAVDEERSGVARREVEKLNSKIVAVTRSKINQAREKILVAGGDLKHEGMLAYLRQRDAIGVTPTVIVTDEGTAEHLLSALE